MEGEPGQEKETDTVEANKEREWLGIGWEEQD
jgi:hypothetical protein